MQRQRGTARVNGDEVPVYEYEDARRSFYENPQAQQTVLTMLGLGIGAYNAAKTVAATLPNPAGSGLTRALPWAAISAASFLIARHAGRMRVPAQLAGGVAAVKAAYEFLRR